MKAYRLNATDVQLAVSLVNVKYNGNLNLLDCRDESNSRNMITSFRLRPIATKLGTGLAPGARWSAHRKRRVSSCCWHVWYDVIGKLFEINPDSRVVTSMYYACPLTFQSEAYNARFRNIGSYWSSSLYIDACDCTD